MKGNKKNLFQGLPTSDMSLLRVKAVPFPSSVTLKAGDLLTLPPEKCTCRYIMYRCKQAPACIVIQSRTAAPPFIMQDASKETEILKTYLYIYY